MRKTWIITIFAFLFLSPCVKADLKPDFTMVDQLTYRYYIEKKWDSVILVGKQALQQNIDYYYLRARLGVAYFEKGKYIPAITHLKKAREFNPDDTFTGGYLYYACLYANREEESGMIEFPGGTGKNSNGISFDAVHATGGYTFSSDRNPGNLSTLMGNDSIYGEQDLYGNTYYTNAGLRLKISRNLRLTATYNYLNFSKTKYVQYGRTEAYLDSIADNEFSRDYYYSFPWVIHDTAMSYKISQHEVYLNLSWMAPHDIKVVPAVHYIHVGYPVISQTMTDSISDTAYFLKSDNSYYMFSYPSVSYFYNTKDTTFSNWVMSLAVSRRFGIFDLGLNGSWSNLNGFRQKQAGVALSYFPLGNLNFYGTSTATFFAQKSDKRLLFSQLLGAKITPWMWGEVNFYYGDHTNANIGNGSIVYNNADIIKYRTGANLIFLVGKHLHLALIYQYFQKESRQYYYQKVVEPDPMKIITTQQLKTNPYHTNSIILGITWKL